MNVICSNKVYKNILIKTHKNNFATRSISKNKHGQRKINEGKTNKCIEYFIGESK